MFNILVAEDDGGTRFLMKTVLEGGGYNVITACNGVEALDILAHEHIDLIVLDVMMPLMDGYEFTRILRQGANDIPILICLPRSLMSKQTIRLSSCTFVWWLKTRRDPLT